MLHRKSVPKHTLELLGNLSAPSQELGFYLAGGTALSLRLGHRISVDLDFFKYGEFSVEEVIDMVQTYASKVKVIQRSAFSVAMIADNTKVEYLRYDYGHLSEVEEVDSLFLCSFIDNALMKLSAVTGRGAKKDFADLAQILKVISLSELLQKFSIKYSNLDLFMVLKSLTWFEDAELDPDPEWLIDEDWDQVKKTISRAVENY